MSLVKIYPFDKLLYPKDLIPSITVADITPSTVFSKQSHQPRPKVKTFSQLKDITPHPEILYPFLYFYPTNFLIIDWTDGVNNYYDVPLLDFQKVYPNDVVALTIHEHFAGGNISELSGLYHYVNMSALTIINQHELKTVAIPKIPLLTYVVVTFNGLTSFDISDNTYINHVDCSYNPLSDVNINGATSLQFFDAGECELTEESVNHILYELDQYGNTNGFIDLSGGSNAAPTGIGATAVTNLLAKGWTVSTN